MANLTLEDAGTMLLQNVVKHLPNSTVSHIQEDLNTVCVLFKINFHTFNPFIRLFFVNGILQVFQNQTDVL